MARTMQEVRAECAQLGITPGRSIEECEKRISAHMSAVHEQEHRDHHGLGPNDPLVTVEQAAPIVKTERGQFRIRADATPEEAYKAAREIGMLASEIERLKRRAAQMTKHRVSPKPVSNALRRKQIAKLTKRQQRAKGG